MFKFFKRKTVASITSGMTRMIRDLETHAEAKAAEIEAHAAAEVRLGIAKLEATKAAQEAKAIADKLRSLVSA